MHLRGRALAGLALLVGIIVAVHLAAGYFVVLPRFAVLERDECAQNIQRVMSAFESEVAAIERGCYDWSAWDESCDFIATHDPVFLEKNVLPTVFHDLRLNLIQFYDADGKLVWSETRDIATTAPLGIPGLSSRGFEPDSALLRRHSATDSLGGLILAGDQLLMVAACPIVPSDHRGPVRGVVIHGRLLTEKEIDRIGGQAQVAFELLPRGKKDLPPEATAALSDSIVRFNDARDELIYGYAAMQGVEGAPVAALRVEMPRRIWAEGRDVIGDSTLFVLATTLIVALAAWWLYDRVLLRPIQRLVQFSIPDRNTRRLAASARASASWEVERFFRTVAAVLTEPIALVDAATDRIIESNDSFAERAGKPRETLRGMRLSDFFVPSDSKSADQGTISTPGTLCSVCEGEPQLRHAELEERAIPGLGGMKIVCLRLQDLPQAALTNRMNETAPAEVAVG